jgi:hypothetical protein
MTKVVQARVVDYMDIVDQDDCLLLEEMHEHGHGHGQEQKRKQGHRHGQGQQGGRV